MKIGYPGGDCSLIPTSYLAHTRQKEARKSRLHAEM